MVRGSLDTCVSDLSLLPVLTDVLLSPLGESSCCDVFVPAVALFVESSVKIGDIVDLCDSILCCVDGACLDLDLLDVVVARGIRPVGAGGGGGGRGPLVVDMGVTILVAVDIVSELSCVIVASSSSIGIGAAGAGASGGLPLGFAPKYGMSGASLCIVWLLSSSVLNNLIQQQSNQQCSPNVSLRLMFDLAEHVMLRYNSGLLHGHQIKML